MLIFPNYLFYEYEFTFFRFESFPIEPFAELRRRPPSSGPQQDDVKKSSNDENSPPLHSNMSNRNSTQLSDYSPDQVRNYRVTIIFRNARNQSQGSFTALLLLLTYIKNSGFIFKKLSARQKFVRNAN